MHSVYLTERAAASTHTDARTRAQLLNIIPINVTIFMPSPIGCSAISRDPLSGLNMSPEKQVAMYCRARGRFIYYQIITRKTKIIEEQKYDELK